MDLENLIPALLEKWGWTSPTLILVATMLVRLISIKLLSKNKTTGDVLEKWLSKIPAGGIPISQMPDLSKAETEPVKQTQVAPVVKPEPEKKAVLSDEKDAIILIGELRSVKFSKENGQSRIRIAGNLKIETTNP